MPDVKDTHLRIYCICGQKMKVSPKMYGLPGKCIACRQKIRIPTSEQVPEGVTEIYIKDRPELLRGPKRSIDDKAREQEAQEALNAAKVRRDLDGDSTPITELDLADGSPKPLKREAGATLPIDVLEPLQKLCSFQYKLERQIFTLDEYHHDDKALIAEVKGHLTRVAKLRTELDDHLHQLLMEVAIELTHTQEKIAQDRLSARVGEISFDEYQDRIYRLRARRERLERRQQNLRGWLATQDPYVAGGFLDLPLNTIGDEGAKIEVPSKMDDHRPLLAAYVASLKEALGRRARAEQKLDEAERLAFDEEDEESLDEAQLECQMEKRMARAEVRFFLDRLERLKKDYTGDIETVNAQMEAARDRLKVDEISRQQYDDIEQRLLRAKKDLAKARSVAARALIANTTSDIPQPGGTFLQRLGFRGARETAPDMWLGWLSALALCAGLFLPLVGDASLVRALIENQGLGAAALLLLAPSALAIAVATATRVPKEVTRGLTLLALWAAGICLAAYSLYLAFTSLDPLAAQFRAGNAWEFRPGVWMIGAGLAGIAAAALAALWSYEKLRPLALTAIALGVAVIGFVPTDVVGLVAPRPTVDVLIEDAAEGPEQAGSIQVTNLGRRALRLVSQPTSARGSYFFVIERRVGENSWSEIGADVTAGTSADPAGVLRTIVHGETHSVPFSLLPGEYRVLLLPGASGTELAERFTVGQPEMLKPVLETPPAPPEVPKPADLLPAAQEETESEAAPQPRPGVARLPSLVKVELKGVMTGPDGETRFSFVLYLPNGRENSMMLSLGDSLWGEWNVAEFNPSYRTVTLQRGEKLLILRRGEQNDLPF